MNYQPVIGLEIHCELKTRTKMFCSCKNDSDETQPNLNICPICMGHPGTLPVINKKAVEMVIKTGLALNCKIAKETYFERKNYFYPDLPKGYQVSQYAVPLCAGGYLEIPNTNRRIRITRIHLEEDTGKLLHSPNEDYSLIDFNRAGVPLMELVTEPDIQSAKEARQFAQELQLILRYLGISDADMEKGQMRVEVNISLSNITRIKSNEARIPNESQIVLKEESYKLMGLLFEVHRKLGSVYKEKNYQDAIEEILKRERIPYKREEKITLKFENLEISNFFADFIIDKKILLEVKVKKFITQNDIRQTLRYIKSANLPLGIIVNFRHDKLEYKRLINPAFDFNSLSFVQNSGALGVKVEIKNLNSFQAVEKASEYEIKRQSEILNRGEKVIQETRGWDGVKGKTFSQRIKEEANDYRYFPEPDLPPLQTTSYKTQATKNMPELPQQKRERFQKEYNLGRKETEVLIQNKELADYFEKVASELKDWAKTKKISQDKIPSLIKLATNYLETDLLGLMRQQTTNNKQQTTNFGDLKITPENFAELMTILWQEEISSRAGKDVLLQMFKTGADPTYIIDDKKLRQVSDEGQIEEIVKKIIKENSKPVEDYKKGKENALQFLVGQIMKETKGRANPDKAREILKSLLK